MRCPDCDGAPHRRDDGCARCEDIGRVEPDETITAEAVAYAKVRAADRRGIERALAAMRAELFC